MEHFIAQSKSEDIESVCHVHLQSFQGEFLSSFGNEFLKVYYRNSLFDSEHLLLVAKVQDEIVGFVAGTLDNEDLYQNLFKKNFFTIALIAIKRFLFSKDFRNQVLKRKHFIRDAIKSRFPKRKNKKDSMYREMKQETSGKCCNLISIAVLDSFRGSGVALDLTKAFESEMQKMGAVEGELYVKTGNTRGIDFYKKAGWQIANEYSKTMRLTKEFSGN